MKFNEVTTRNYGDYLAKLERIAPGKDSEYIVRIEAYVQAARDAGIVEDLPEQFAEGDLLALPPYHLNALIDLGLEINDHLVEQLSPPSGE